MKDVKASIEAAVTFLSQHPDEAKYTDSFAVAVLEEGLRCRIEGPKGEVVVTDMPLAVGGGEAGPSPGWLFRAALAGCDAALIAMEAAKAGVRLDSLEVTVDSVSDDRGILAMDISVPAGPLSIGVRVSIRGNATAEHLKEIALRGIASCPVHEGAGRAVPVAINVTVG